MAVGISYSAAVTYITDYTHFVCDFDSAAVMTPVRAAYISDIHDDNSDTDRHVWGEGRQYRGGRSSERVRE